MVVIIVILAIALFICIRIIINSDNEKTAAVRYAEVNAEKKYSARYERDKADYCKKLDKEYQLKFTTLTEERDQARSSASSYSESNKGLRAQVSDQALRILELEAQYGHFMKHPELSRIFLRLLSLDADAFLRYMEFLDYFFSHYDRIKTRLHSLLSTEYTTGKTDIISHLSDEHILSVDLPSISTDAIKVKGSHGEYVTTLSSCTCTDYNVRKRPCKHMLALAKKFDLLWIYGSYINAEIDHRIRKLTAFVKEKEAEISSYDAVLATKRTEFEKQLKQEREVYLQELTDREAQFAKIERSLVRRERLLADKEKALAEKAQSYPWLASRLAELELLSKSIRMRDPLQKRDMTSLLNKQTREIALLRNQLAVYEYLFPMLEEFKEIEPQKASELISSGAGDDSFHYQWLSESEYDVLTSAEKSNRWIQRYFGEHSKTAWEAGIKYERFIGYLCEKKGYTVKYNGAVMHKEDMGRDLIVTQDNHIYAIQCKRFSKSKEIHENHIFQLLGTVIHLRAQNPTKTVSGAFVTSAQLSDVARECAKVVGIKVFECVPFIKYPSIKCNIGRDGQKIYHLPYDQQYDRIQISLSKGECYVSTCEEAERLGFRHAWKHTFS